MSILPAQKSERLCDLLCLTRISKDLSDLFQLNKQGQNAPDNENHLEFEHVFHPQHFVNSNFHIYKRFKQTKLSMVCVKHDR